MKPRNQEAAGPDFKSERQRQMSNKEYSLIQLSSPTRPAMRTFLTLLSQTSWLPRIKVVNSTFPHIGKVLNNLIKVDLIVAL